MSKNKTDIELQQELLNSLDEICEQLGWTVVVPTETPGEPSRGFIVGESDFLAEILASFGVDFEEFMSQSGEIIESEDVEVKVNRKKETFH